MEPIRLDQDEVRSRAPVARTVSEKASKKRATPPPGQPESGATLGGGKGLLLVLVIALALGGVFWLQMQQQKQLDTLSVAFNEADSYIRQSKLSLARFEGQLSETGEVMQQSGATVSNRLGALEVANKKLEKAVEDRDRKAINALEADVARLQGLSKPLPAALEALSKTQTAVKTQLASLDAAQASVKAELQTIQTALAAEQTAREAIVQQVDAHNARARQEQQLAWDEVRARLDKLEGQAGKQAEAQAMLQRLASIEEAIKAIDAARTQINARLLNLTGRVDQLQGGGVPTP